MRQGSAKRATSCSGPKIGTRISITWNTRVRQSKRRSINPTATSPIGFCPTRRSTSSTRPARARIGARRATAKRSARSIIASASPSSRCRTPLPTRTSRRRGSTSNRKSPPARTCSACCSSSIGSRHGYVGHEEGGQLTEKVKRNPYSVVLLDEIEKAHPDIFNILLQVFEDGHLTDGLGNRVNFKNTIIIMTSNIGARFIQKKSSMGFQSTDTGTIAKSVSDMLLGEVKRTFNPECINRIDEIIVFEALGDDDLRRIMALLVTQLNENLVDRKLKIALSPEVIDWIIEVTCKDRSYGARPLRRATHRYVEDPLPDEPTRGHLPAAAL